MYTFHLIFETRDVNSCSGSPEYNDIKNSKLCNSVVAVVQNSQRSKKEVRGGFQNAKTSVI